jgi:hypothetical protein
MHVRPRVKNVLNAIAVYQYHFEILCEVTKQSRNTLWYCNKLRIVYSISIVRKFTPMTSGYSKSEELL